MEDVTPLTEYAARFRYPGAPWEPTLQEAQESIEIPRTFVQTMLKRLPPPITSFDARSKDSMESETKTQLRPRGSYRLQIEVKAGSSRRRDLRASRGSRLDDALQSVRSTHAVDDSGDQRRGTGRVGRGGVGAKPCEGFASTGPRYRCYRFDSAQPA